MTPLAEPLKLKVGVRPWSGRRAAAGATLPAWTRSRVGQRAPKRVVVWKNLQCSCGHWIASTGLRDHLATPMHVEWKERQARALKIGVAR